MYAKFNDILQCFNRNIRCVWVGIRRNEQPGANHGAISYGHIGADLITMCSMLRIPVCMHNVDEADIYRPAAYNAFGMDKEGQDYRACNPYGPMYRNIRK